MIYPKIKQWCDDFHGQLFVTLDPDNNVLIASKYVELFYKTVYRNYVSIAEDTETLKDLWDFYLLEMLPQLQREYKAITIQYNPIENYSMTEHGEDSDTITNNLNVSGSNSQTGNASGGSIASGSNTTNYGATSGTSAETVAPFDSATYHNNKQLNNSETAHTDTADTETTTNTTSTTTASGTSSQSTTGTVTTEKEHDFNRSGNVGVTTSQQMIASELELRKTHIVRDFLTNFARRYFFIDMNVELPVVPSIDDLIAEILRRIPKAEEDEF